MRKFSNQINTYIYKIMLIGKLKTAVKRGKWPCSMQLFNFLQEFNTDAFRFPDQYPPLLCSFR